MGCLGRRNRTDRGLNACTEGSARAIHNRVPGTTAQQAFCRQSDESAVATYWAYQRWSGGGGGTIFTDFDEGIGTTSLARPVRAKASWLEILGPSGQLFAPASPKTPKATASARELKRGS